MRHISEIQQIMDELKKENIIPFDKLIPLYKYVDIPTAKLILAGSTIKYSTPKELNANDFDEQRFDVNCTNDYLEAMKRKAFAMLRFIVQPRLANKKQHMNL